MLLDPRLPSCYTEVNNLINRNDRIRRRDAVLLERLTNHHLSEFLRYLASRDAQVQDSLPSLSELSTCLGISVASLREQLEVARALGLVEVKPRTGIRRLPYSFRPTVVQSLSYAVALDPAYFSAFSDLRNHIEMAYWFEAVSRLSDEDCAELGRLIERAFEKLHSSPIQIPHPEHRELHLNIYRRLNNPFVEGILEAYWELYEASGLDLYADLAYLERVWGYHRRMVECICEHNYQAGYEALVEHMGLIHQRSKPNTSQKFE